MSASGGCGFPVATPLAPSFTTFIPILGGSGGCLGVVAFNLLSLVLVTLSFLYVTFALVMTTFATVTTGEVRKSPCHVFLGGLDPGQAPLQTLLLMLRLT